MCVLFLINSVESLFTSCCLLPYQYDSNLLDQLLQPPGVSFIIFTHTFFILVILYLSADV